MTRFIGISALFFFFSFSSSFVQAKTDTERYPIFDVFFEGGIFFPGSENLINAYDANSLFNYSVGIKPGFSDWEVMPWLRYSKYSAQANISKLESMSRQQVALGLEYLLYTHNDNRFYIKPAISYNYIEESYINLNDKSLGFLMSVGYQKIHSRYFSHHFDIGYDYARVSESELLRDWSGWYFSFGIGINLALD